MLTFDKLSASDKLSTASKPSGLRTCFLVHKTLGFNTLSASATKLLNGRLFPRRRLFRNRRWVFAEEY